jgi:putative endonuclease
MTDATLALGKTGEDYAADFLQGQGYRILLRNYRNKLGEIDIIARDAGVLCFVEVKSRASEKRGEGLEAVAFPKQRQIAKAALGFLKQRRLFGSRARFDVVSVTFGAGAPEIKLVKNAFELEQRFAV